MSEKFWISTVKSRMDKRIEGHEFTWEEFVSKFENPLRTSETLLEYASMDSDARANAKDVGGIIPGHFLGDNRKDAQVEDIRLLKLDVDEIPSYLDFVSCVESVLQGYSFFVHSTHSHTKAAPRYRVFILLSRNVTSEEYGALAAVVEKKFPISFDEHGRSVKQIMYWPSVCKDGEYIFKSYAGEALNVDALLSKAEAIDIPVPKKTVEDPLSKPGLIGAFNRAHSITDILNETPNTDYYLNNLTDYDDALIQLLYQFIGVILSNIPGWRMKKALFLVGPGDTGKSLLKSLVEKILGKDNYIGMDLKDIEARFGTGNIYGMRLAGSSDMSFLSIDELKTFKKCTGGDSLFAEFKGQDGFEFTYKGLLWFCMNKAPKFGGDNGEWVYNRIMLVRCENVIPAAKQDKHLLDKMYAERAGIVHRAVMALKSVIDGSYRFAEPDTVLAARKSYMTENNTVISFFEECMQYRVGGKIKDGCTTGKVYDVYKAWCKDNNHGYAKTAKEFRDELALHLGSSFSDITCRRGKGGTFYKDYTLTDESKERYSAAYGYDPTQVFSNVS